MIPGFGGAAQAHRAGGPGPRPESQVKAAFVYNFVQFVRWPDAAFADAASPLVLCVVGADPAGDELDALSGRTVQGRPMVVKHATALEEAGECHVLYLDGAAAERWTRTGPKREAKPVLAIADQQGFAARGGLINFFKAGGRIRFAINRAAAQRAGLTISSKLLSLAEIVGDR